MRKAISTNRVLIGLTLVFMLIAALSFAAFDETKSLCGEAKNCTRSAPAKRSGEMLWDGFSRRFVSLIAIK
ncbi:MAG TPA: hypothetical protein VER36_02755 [Flavisolibacter sp.]|nr:hypothetical protein [Flavisolibacter sp.]